MSRRTQVILLVSLLGLLAAVVIYERLGSDAAGEVFNSGSAQYRPLKVEDPALRFDLLEKIHKLEYTGSHRNIFSNVAPPPDQARSHGKNPPVVTPPVDSEPPPIAVPVTFFGYAANPQTGKKQAFFTNGDDVYVVDEGGVLLKQFRVVKILPNSVELEQLSDGRHTTLTMEQPPAQQ
ncbi:MAG: hypothetical protein ACRD50_16550 [Candidatus Acidiferrales bacterium]